MQPEDSLALNMLERPHYSKCALRTEQLDFDGRDRVYCMSTSDGLSTALAKAISANLASLDIFRESSHSFLDRDVYIDASRQKDVKENLAIQNFEAIIDALSNGRRAIIWTCKGKGAFDAENNFLAVLGIGCEVVVQQLE